MTYYLSPPRDDEPVAAWPNNALTESRANSATLTVYPTSRSHPMTSAGNPVISPPKNTISTITPTITAR